MLSGICQIAFRATKNTACFPVSFDRPHDAFNLAHGWGLSPLLSLVADKCANRQGELAAPSLVGSGVVGLDLRVLLTADSTEGHDDELPGDLTFDDLVNLKVHGFAPFGC